MLFYSGSLRPPKVLLRNDGEKPHLAVIDRQPGVLNTTCSGTQVVFDLTKSFDVGLPTAGVAQHIMPERRGAMGGFLIEDARVANDGLRGALHGGDVLRRGAQVERALVGVERGGAALILRL